MSHPCEVCGTLVDVIPGKLGKPEIVVDAANQCAHDCISYQNLKKSQEQAEAHLEKIARAPPSGVYPGGSAIQFKSGPLSEREREILIVRSTSIKVALEAFMFANRPGAVSFDEVINEVINGAWRLEAAVWNGKALPTLSETQPTMQPALPTIPKRGYNEEGGYKGVPLSKEWSEESEEPVPLPPTTGLPRTAYCEGSSAEPADESIVGAVFKEAGVALPKSEVKPAATEKTGHYVPKNVTATTPGAEKLKDQAPPVVVTVFDKSALKADDLPSVICGDCGGVVTATDQKIAETFLLRKDICKNCFEKRRKDQGKKK